MTTDVIITLVILTILILIWLARLIISTHRQARKDNTIAIVTVILGDIITAAIIIWQLWRLAMRC